VASFAFIAFVYVVAGGLIVSLRIRNPLDPLQGSNQVASVRGAEGPPDSSQRAFQ
jgi:hypothetical protein